MNNVAEVEMGHPSAKRPAFSSKAGIGNSPSWWRWVAAFFGLLVLLVIAAFAFSQKLLTIDSGNVKADAIVLLGGGASDRPARAAELFAEGAAPEIIVSGIGDNNQNVQWLEKNGVPAANIIEENLSSSTLENAEFSIPKLRQMGAHRVILVTTWYHSRRALACFEHFAPDITFYSRPSYFSYAHSEWKIPHTFGYVASEYMKLPGYWLYYGVRPFPL